ncbi:MAG: TRAP transporter small permease [Candidatus Heteroscillospira sp.]|jgi:C4-dicarboxylate transporter DctQ subunit
MFKRLKEQFHGYEIEEILLSFMLMAMLIICTMQVIWRYVLESSLSWSEECARYIFVWMVWIAAAYATKRMRHLRITCFKELAPADKQWIFDLFALIMMAIFAAIFSINATQMVIKVQQTGQLSPAMRVPMWIPYLSVPVGITLLGVRAVQNIYFIIKEHLRPGEKEGER